MAKVTKEDCIKALKDYYKQTGEIPKVNAFRKAKPSITSYYSLFGSWNNAMKEAGFPTKKQGGEIKVTEEIILQKVREYYQKYGRPPKAKNFPTTFMRIGKWNNILRKAGVPIGKMVGYNKEQMIKDLKNFIMRLGRVPERREFAKIKGMLASPATYVKAFGSWNNAIKKAGFEPTKVFFRSKDEIIKALWDFYNRNKRIPDATDFIKIGVYHRTILKTLNCKHWSEVLIKAGFEKAKWARKNDFEYKWEYFVISAVKAIYPDANIKKRIKTNELNIIPDAHIPSHNLIIDAKLSDYYWPKKTKEQYEKYKKIASNIEYWCLYKKNAKKKLPVIYKYADDIKRTLDKKNLVDLSKQCSKFIILDDDIRKMSGMWTKSMIELEIQRFIKEYKTLPDSKKLAKVKGYPGYDTIVRLLGCSLRTYLKNRGYAVSNYGGRYNNKEEVLNLVSEFIKRNGRVPNINEYGVKYNMPSSKTIERFFGSFPELYKALGVESPMKVWTKEELISILQEYHKKHGKTPTREKIEEMDGPSHATYRKKFGSWNDALIAANLKPNMLRTKNKKEKNNKEIQTTLT